MHPTWWLLTCRHLVGMELVHVLMRVLLLLLLLRCRMKTKRLCDGRQLMSNARAGGTMGTGREVRAGSVWVILRTVHPCRGVRLRHALMLHVVRGRGVGMLHVSVLWMRASHALMPWMLHSAPCASVLVERHHALVVHAGVMVGRTWPHPRVMRWCTWRRPHHVVHLVWRDSWRGLHVHVRVSWRGRGRLHVVVRSVGSHSRVVRGGRLHVSVGSRRPLLLLLTRVRPVVGMHWEVVQSLRGLLTWLTQHIVTHRSSALRCGTRLRRYNTARKT